MTATLDYASRKIMRELYKEDRWGVLTILILHADERNHCWPTTDGMAYDLDLSVPTVVRAKKWLLDHGAIELVPYSERTGAECGLPIRQHVYHLTGQVTIENGQTVPYLYGQPSETKCCKTSQHETSQHEVLPRETLTEFSLTIPIEESTISRSSTDPTLLTPAPAATAKVESAGPMPDQEKSADLQTKPAIQENAPSTPVPPPPSPLQDAEPQVKVFYSSPQAAQGFQTASPPPVDLITLYASHRGTTFHLAQRGKWETLCGQTTTHLLETPREGVEYRICDKCERVHHPPPPRADAPLIAAYHNAIPQAYRPARPAFSKENIADALALAERGITPDGVTRFVTETYPGYLDWARAVKGRPILMSFRHVADRIAGWLTEQNRPSDQESTNGQRTRSTAEAMGNESPTRGVAGGGPGRGHPSAGGERKAPHIPSIIPAVVSNPKRAKL